MSASRRMWLSFLLFGLTFFVFDSGITAEHSWPRPLVIGFGVASLLFFLYAMYVFYFDVTKGDKHLQKQGIRGTAVVLRATRTRTQAQTGQADFQAPFIWKYQLNVSLPGKPPYEAVCSVARDGIAEGSTVEVAVSKFNRRNLAILGRRPGPGVPHRNWSQSPGQFPAPGRYPAPGQYPAPGPYAPGGQYPADRLGGLLQAAQNGGIHLQGPGPEAGRLAALAKLGELHSQGVLTDAEFAAEKARIMGH